RDGRGGIGGDDRERQEPRGQRRSELHGRPHISIVGEGDGGSGSACPDGRNQSSLPALVETPPEPLTCWILSRNCRNPGTRPGPGPSASAWTGSRPTHGSL